MVLKAASRRAIARQAAVVVIVIMFQKSENSPSQFGQRPSNASHGGGEGAGYFLLNVWIRKERRFPKRCLRRLAPALAR